MALAPKTFRFSPCTQNFPVQPPHKQPFTVALSRAQQPPVACYAGACRPRTLCNPHCPRDCSVLPLCPCSITQATEI